MAVLGGGGDVVERSTDRALACVLVLCALMLVSRALAAAWRVVHERRIVRAWMRTEFEGGRHMRRIEKIMALENKEA